MSTCSSPLDKSLYIVYNIAKIRGDRYCHLKGEITMFDILDRLIGILTRQPIPIPIPVDDGVQNKNNSDDDED